MSAEKKRQNRILIPVLIMIFIFVQSAFPADLSSRESGFIVSLVRLFWKADPEVITHVVRKCAHFIEYLALGWSLMAPARDRFETTSKVLIYSWIFGSLYAVTDEIHQIFVDGRSCQFSDFAVDSAGVLTGLLIGCAIYALRIKGMLMKQGG